MYVKQSTGKSVQVKFPFASKISTSYTNPIIPGFAPDPSVVFVDNTFFLVNSSFHIFPGLPIYASKDLKSWTHIGEQKRFQQKENATTDVFPIGPDKNLVAALGLFAPTIRWHNGVFYIVCTNTVRPDGGEFRTDNFIITTRDIWANEWSDPIWFKLDGIDPSLFFDDTTDKVDIWGPFEVCMNNPVLTTAETDERFSGEGNSIKLTPSTKGLSATHGTETFVGKIQIFSNSIATTTLCIPTEPHVKTGLSLFKENVRHVDICYDTDTHKITLEVCLQLKGEPKVVAEVKVATQKAQMKISSSAESYEFFSRAETSKEWVLLGSIDALDMTACDFTGTLFGIFAVKMGPRQAAGTVRFENFVVS
ncbi:Xylosidase/arabinosidase [Penicillium cataractarum]|uniref:Xylosidase/arabinosidase n=1 Tax=Penicillium cataractarum TaxID=2100454 RepID=A0A9W9VHJ8_9EURO|nr:Xylosidase/arabinosidase [Penicillium cataractarum]KAJ5379720.1 Xylosidase/arabinosidase [Penicillium cataractarum]